MAETAVNVHTFGDELIVLRGIIGEPMRALVPLEVLLELRALLDLLRSRESESLQGKKRKKLHSLGPVRWNELLGPQYVQGVGEVRKQKNRSTSPNFFNNIPR